MNIPRSYITITMDMKKIILVLFFMCSFFSVPALCDEVEINSEVIVINPEHEFLVISAGEDKGVELGDGLIVHRDGEKIAEAYIIGVKPDVAAAEILNIEKDSQILEGDSALIVKEMKVVREKTPKELPGTKTATAPRLPAPEFTKQGDTINIEIDNGPAAVFSYAVLLLKENGYSIVSTNRATGTILASKPLNLSLLKELFADAIAAIDHKVVVSMEIKGKGGTSVLTGFSFMEHSQKSKYIKRPVTDNSKYYNDMADLFSKIKQRSEYIEE